MANDLISRQAAVDAIVGMTTMSIEELANAGNKERFDWIKGLSDSLVKINNLSSAEPEIIYCKDCVKHNKCKFYQTQGDNGYCRYGRSEDGRLNP